MTKKLLFFMCMIATATASQAITVSTHDVDRNYVINGSDVTALYNILLSDTGTAQGGDVDNNGVVNGSDVTALYNYLLGDNMPRLVSIAEFKKQYWQDDKNYATTIEEDIVIAGRVTANDEAGNIYKELYLEDNTGAIAISLDANRIYWDFPLGQQIEISLRGLAIGKYNNHLLIGKPEWYDRLSVWEPGRIPLEEFTPHVQKIGSPEPEKVVPTICNIADVADKTDADTQLAYQNRLVTFNDVEWRDADPGTPFVGDSYSTMYRDIIDMEGNSIPVTISFYSNFANDTIPMGRGKVTGVLYVSGAFGIWRLYLRDKNDYSGFSTTTKGTKTDPLTVDEAINIDHDGHCWVKGNIVGATTAATVKSNADVEWNAPFTAGAALVIGNDASTRDLAHCLVVELPAGSAFAASADMGKYSELLGCEILVRGIIGTVKGTRGITGNNGTEDEFVMSKLVGGVTALNETFENGLPADWTQVQVQGDKKWYTTSFNSNTYAAMSGYKGTPPFESWLITPAIDIKNAPSKTLSFRSQVNNYGSATTKLEVYVLSSDDPTTAVKVQLHPTLATAPASGYSDWAQSGTIDLSAFADGSYCIGFVYTADNDTNYATWVIDDVKIGE